MDPQLIDADDSQRAKSASLRSPDFRRMVGLAWPHRRLIALGMIASLVYGILNSVSIVGMLPVFTVLLSEEGLHARVYRETIESRLGVELQEITDARGGIGQVAELHVKDIDHDSPLQSLGSVTAIVRPVETESSAADWMRRLATSEGEVEIHYLLRRDNANAPQTVHIATLQRNSLSTKHRALTYLARFLPVETQRADRIAILGYLLLVIVAIVLLTNVARFVAQYFVAAGVLRSVMDLRRRLYRKVLRLPMDFFTRDTADIVSRFVQDAQEIQRGMMSLFGKLVREPVKAIFILVAAVYINAQLTITMLLMAPVAVILFWLIGRKIKKANKKLLQAYGFMIGALGTTLQAIGVVKAYNAERAERKRLWNIDRKMFKHQLRIAKLEALMSPLLEVLGVTAGAGVTYWLGAQVMRNELPIDEFGVVLAALVMLLDPLRKFADVYPRVTRSAAGAHRIFSVLDAPAEAELDEGTVELPPLAEKIEFDCVTYSYPQSAGPALRDVSLTINRGETVAVVGPNGSGKTTLCKLIVRFHDPQSGKISFDGTDVRSATLSSIRRQVSLVTQDPVVFAMSIADNIAYGSRNGKVDRVVEAARRAHADEFISTRPGGYDEIVGERGVTLSGGQRQRLCIARAIMRNAPILIFDEATSQIDSESEEKIQNAVREFSQGRTTIMIAHRLSTIRFAARIIVMDAGMVIDTGTHEELVQRCALYATLCKTQLAE